MFKSTIYPFFFRDGQFYCWVKPEYPEKTTGMQQVTENKTDDTELSFKPVREEYE